MRLFCSEKMTYKPEGCDAVIEVTRINRITKLPPYLIFQFKRFTYSIETGTRSKIDQEYVFKYTIDLKEHISEKQESCYRLLGVLVHQGDADTGHYVSYVRRREDDWICLNDTGVHFVKTGVMRNDANGCSSGSSAYLLFYERVDAASVKLAVSPDSRDDQLLAEIQSDNMRLVVDSVYFSEAFADFMLELLKRDSLTKAAYKYISQILMHSSMTAKVRRFADILQEEGNAIIIKELMHDDVSTLVDTVSGCTNQEIRTLYCQIIRTVFLTCGADNELIDTLLSQFVEWWLRIVLACWRVSFDFFRIICDYAALGDEYKQHLLQLDATNIFTLFITEAIPQFIANKSTNVTAERFSRLCDMTYFLKCLVIVQADPNVILDRRCVKFMLTSERHPSAFVELYLHYEPGKSGLGKLIEDCGGLSEFLVIELVKLDGFVIPNGWGKRYFAGAPKQKHLLQAISDAALKDVEFVTRLLRNNSSLFRYLLFSKIAEVRSDSLDLLRRIAGRLPDFVRYVSQILSAIGLLSRHRLPSDAKMKAIHIDSFVAVPFLRFLLETAKTHDDVQAFVGPVQESLKVLAPLPIRRDEHAILVAQLALVLMMRSIVFVGESIVNIQVILAKMLPDHRELDTALYHYVLGMANVPITFSQKFPDSELSVALFKALLVKDRTFATARRHVIEFFKGADRSYAAGSKLLRHLQSELAKYDTVDSRSLIEVFAPFAKVSGVIAAHAEAIGRQPNVFARLVAAANAAEPNEAVFDGAVLFGATLIELAKDHFAPVLAENAALIAPWIRTALNMQLWTETSALALKTVQLAVAAAPAQVGEIYAEYVIADAWSAPEADQYVAVLIESAAKAKFPVAKAIEEFVAVVQKASKLSDIARVCVQLNKLPLGSEVVDALRTADVLVKLVALEAGDDTKFPGLIRLAQAIITDNSDSGLPCRIQAAARGRERSPFQRAVLALLSS
jgi:hypothetical protein